MTKVIYVELFGGFGRMIYEIRYLFRRNDWNGLKNCMKTLVPAKIESNVIFRKHWHRWIDFKNPVFFDEKLLILKAGEYRHNRLITSCTDKYNVRAYVRSKGLGKLLVELYGAYDSADDIPFEKLPERYAIKCNHGCAMNIIVTESSCLDVNRTKQKLNTWMKIDFGLISGEKHYSGIQPKIIVEKYIGEEDGTLPVDYKFYASRGKVICCLAIAGRGGKQKRVFVDTHFQDTHLIDHVEDYIGNDYGKLKPKSYAEMVKTAEKLSEDFPFVRVDLYDKDGRVIFGELTFTPHGCCHTYMDKAAQEWIGKQIVL